MIKLQYPPHWTLPLVFMALSGCFGLLLTGCGAHASAVSIPDVYSNLPSNTFTMYPGQTVTVPIVVVNLGNVSDKVTFTASSLPSGVTMAPVTATPGTIANLTFVSTTALAKELFTGAYTWSADSDIMITATGKGGTSAIPLVLETVLTNPAFTPSTTNIPVVDIETTGQAPITSKDTYVTGSMTITDTSNSSNNYSGTMEIKGHGNSTWGMPKKPYRVKLDSKAKLFGMPSEKNWVLLANYDDKTMLRDAVASEVSNIIGMAWAPRSKFVELMLNGAYVGTYQFIENVDINSNRVNITDSDASADPTADGFLMEQDMTQGDTFNWATPHGAYIGSNDPDPPTPAGEVYIQNLVNNSEAAFYAPNAPDPTTGWRADWDQDSLVNWFLVDEFMGNQDADGHSMYFYKDAGAVPFYAGPIWDFDISSGNDNYGAIQSPTVPWVGTTNVWYIQLMKDPTFVAAVKAKWAAVEPQIASTIPDYINTQASALTVAASNNYSRWPNLSQQVWPNPEAAGTYQGEVSYLQQWLASRLAYMNSVYLN